ncbi:MAG: efflux RND transporter permease subunit [Deltaproteobacteria bacterium]|nr:efflux RND transporter permease subunit [Deltaproteobacteria bacterium]
MIRQIIRRPVTVFMLIAGLCLLGAVSFRQLPIELFPNTELPQLIINISGPQNADPAYVEHYAVIPLEGAIAGLENIEKIESYVSRRQATIFVYYNQSSRQKYDFLKLQDRVAAAAAQLTDSFQVKVARTNPEQLSNQFLSFQARGEGGLDQIRSVIDEKVTPQLETIDGVANVNVYGGRKRSIEIVLDSSLLAEFGLTINQVASKINQQAGQRQYLGVAREGRQKYFINLVSEYTNIPDLVDVVVKNTGPITLGQIAEIREGGAEEESISRINGMETITVSLVRSWDTNLLSLAAKTRKAIEDINRRISADGIELVIQVDEARVIEDNMQSIFILGLLGSLLAIAVLWVFIRRLKFVFIIALTIPISVLISMNLFYALGITINTLTLVGIAIAVGMLLDSSVVVLENINRHINRNQTAGNAVVDGTNEVLRAIIAATLTTICIFVPFLFSTEPLIKTLGWQIGVSIIATLLVSLAVAFLLIPTIAYRILSGKKQNTPRTAFSQKQRPMQIYTVLLKTGLRFPAGTLAVCVMAFFISLVICLGLSVNVPREVPLDTFNLYATLPSGTTLETADEQAREMDKRLKDMQEIEERTSSIQEDNIVLTFQLEKGYEKIAGRPLEEIKDSIEGMLDDAFPRIDFSYEEPTQNVGFQGGSGRGQDFQRLLGMGASQEKVILSGQDLEILRAIAEDIQYNIENLDTVRSVNISVSNQQPSIDLLLDKAALKHFDVGLQSVMDELNTFQKEISATVKYMDGPEEVDIILKTEEEEEKTSDDLRRLQIPSASEGLVPITQISKLLYSAGYSRISRINQEKQVTVTYQFESDIEESSTLLDQARTEIEDIVAGIYPPPGVAIEVAHDESDISEFYFLIGIGILLIFMVLASTFESLITPLVMMFTLPLAAVGAFLALILTGNSIYNANALIGFLILLGVVVNNGIILIDYSRILQRKNFRLSRALITAGQTRVRPILITAVTTILAMLPIAMGRAEYISQIGAPFAITVIGGLAFATLFTLVIIPTAAFGLDNTLRWLNRLPLKTKLLMLGLFFLGLVLIINTIHSVLWQSAYILGLLAAIPAGTWFVRTSLRRSRTQLFADDAPITITIRNVSKVYDDFIKFAKEWKKGGRDREVSSGSLPFKERLARWVYLLPLYAFLVFFLFFYIKGGLWRLILVIVFYLATLNLFRTFKPAPGPARRLRERIFDLGEKVVRWGLPIPVLLWLNGLWQDTFSTVFFGMIWYLAILLKAVAKRLEEKGVNIDRLTGRFGRLRRAFYRFVQSVPLLSRKKKPFRALDQISLSIGSGMFGLVGPNGAGKTTLMRIICGILGPSRGKVSFNHLDLEEHREELQALIGYLPQEFGTYENMTVVQFLDYQAMLKGIWNKVERERIVSTALESVHLTDNRDNKIGTFSGGMKQRVGIAQTLLKLPRILVVDEPTAGLDPRERIKFRNLLSELAKDRIVIFSTHIIEDISSSCNKVAVLLEGRVKFVGTPKELVERTRGNVWQALIPEGDLDRIRRATKVVHHMRDAGKVRVRILAGKQPFEEAKQVVPTLEDSYMWLMGSTERNEGDTP